MVGKCEIYKERDVLEGGVSKMGECDMEKFGTLDSSEKSSGYPRRYIVATDGETGREQDEQKKSFPMQYTRSMEQT